MFFVVDLLTEMTSFNEKPFLEQKKSYTARYVGNMEVSSPTGLCDEFRGYYLNTKHDVCSCLSLQNIILPSVGITCK